MKFAARAIASLSIRRLLALASGVPVLALATPVPAAAQEPTTAAVLVYHSTDPAGARPDATLPPGCEPVEEGGSGAPQTIWTTHGDGIRIGTIDPISGVGSDIGATGQSQGWAAAFDLDGTLYTTYGGFSGNPQLATVDQTTGAIASTNGFGST